VSCVVAVVLNMVMIFVLKVEPDIDNVTPEEQDNYVGAEVNLQIGGRLPRDTQISST
jgi:hypothetical protein